MKKALLVGINKYQNPNFALRGCLNDVASFKSLLTDVYSFQNDNIKILQDGDATKANILWELDKLIAEAAVGDTLIFGYSGHGTQYGTDPSQPNGKNDAIVTYSSDLAGLIQDKELYAHITVRGDDFLQKVSFTGVYDCCHSGTMIKDFRLDASGKFILDPTLNRCVFLPEIANKLGTREVLMGPYNTFSACLDEQTAADLSVGGTFRGAFSYVLHDLLRANPNARINDLDNLILPGIQRITSHLQVPNYYAVDITKSVFQ
ncbi:MAG: hypothetical protein JWO03_3457 [Bacteroidetes bacterium]|nr:hypothetical protein [Bacteroidota bacterium]